MGGVVKLLVVSYLFSCWLSLCGRGGFVERVVLLKILQFPFFVYLIPGFRSIGQRSISSL